MKSALLLLLLLFIAPAAHAKQPIYTSIDTMKESRDSINNLLTDAQIQQDVDLSASLGCSHITVDTPYDYPDYMTRWVRAVRKTGRHVWFRSAFNAWEGSYGAKATMTPAQYTAALVRFIHDHPTLFRPGDILDPLPEPENGPYWARISPYGKDWSWKKAPNSATDQFNRFFVGLTKSVDQALHDEGVYGVITHIRSTNGWIAARPATLYPATVAFMGCVTTDTYVGQDPKIAPADALAAVKKEIEGIENARHVPLVLGEFGYSTQGLVDDAQQQAVLAPQFAWLGTLPYLKAINYWHGAGYPAPDKYNGCKLFDGTTGAWHLRPAAKDLSRLFHKLSQSPKSFLPHAAPADSTPSPALR